MCKTLVDVLHSFRVDVLIAAGTAPQQTPAPLRSSPAAGYGATLDRVGWLRLYACNGSRDAGLGRE